MRSGGLAVKHIVGLAVIILVGLLPFWPITNQYIIHLAIIYFIFTMCSAGWNLLGGLAGQVSFGHSSFFGIGAYATAIMWVTWGINPIATLPFAGIIAVLFSLVWGYPVLRLRGPYFAIATIGVGEATRIWMLNWDKVTGGSSGFTMPISESYTTKLPYFYISFVVFLLVILFVRWVMNSKFGMGLVSIKEDHEAAESLGINIHLYQNMALAASAFITGVAGGIYAFYLLYINPERVFAFDKSADFILMSLVGGIGTLFGPVIGGLVFVAMKETIMASFPNAWLLLFGLIHIFVVTYEPKGIIGMMERARGWYRARQKVPVPEMGEAGS